MKNLSFLFTVPPHFLDGGSISTLEEHKKEKKRPLPSRGHAAVCTNHAEGFKKPFLKPVSHEGLWECGSGLKNKNHSGAILVLGGTQKVVFHSFHT